MLENQTKKCKYCDEVKNITLFVKIKIGHGVKCKKCVASSTRAIRKKHKELTLSKEKESISIENNRRKSNTKKGSLYIISDNSKHGWVKIGKTTNLYMRLKQYNCSFSEDEMNYDYVSEILYNIDSAEEELIEAISLEKNIIIRKREWAKNTKNKGKQYIIKTIIKMIEKINDKYFEDTNCYEVNRKQL